jgi:hypothetical protein
LQRTSPLARGASRHAQPNPRYLESTLRLAFGEDWHGGVVARIVTDRLRAYSAAMMEIGAADRHEVGGRLNNRAENSHQPFRRRRRAMQRFRSMKTQQKFQFSSRSGPQLFQSGAPSRHEASLQAETLDRIGGVARPCRVAVCERACRPTRRRTPLL